MSEQMRRPRPLDIYPANRPLIIDATASAADSKAQPKPKLPLGLSRRCSRSPHWARVWKSCHSLGRKSNLVPNAPTSGQR